MCVAHRGIASWIRAFIQLALLGIRTRLASAPQVDNMSPVPSFPKQAGPDLLAGPAGPNS